MKPLYNENDFKSAKSSDKLPCECYCCKKTFYKKKHDIQRVLNPNQSDNGKFCSFICKNICQNKKEKLNCKNCDVEFKKQLNQVKKTKNHFCSQSCAATYNNKNKTHGTRRSKLEFWLEEQLTKSHPDIKIDFNKKDAIGSELDIYIPSLNLAIELNGIFHYEPIYGVDKLQKIQENDISKSKACHDLKIDFCTIDTSSQKYFKESTSKKYLEIINNIIKERLLTS